MAELFPDWLELHSFRVGGPVVELRSRSGIVRVELGEGETADRVLVGLPDDPAWAGLQRAVEDADFWSWPRRPEHREPHAQGDWSWFLDVRWNGREHVAGGWNDAPPHFDEVRDALFELVEQVAK